VVRLAAEEGIVKVMTIKSSFEPALRSLAQDPQLAAAASPEFHPLMPQIVERAPIAEIAPLVTSPFLPSGMALPATSKTGTTDFETLKIVTQEMVLPLINSLWPASKPYVVGVQAIWATKNFWDAITDQEVDTTKRVIAGTYAAQKAVNALLVFQGAPELAIDVNTRAGYLIATANKLYAVRNSAKH